MKTPEGSKNTHSLGHPRPRCGLRNSLGGCQAAFRLNDVVSQFERVIEINIVFAVSEVICRCEARLREVDPISANKNRDANLGQIIKFRSKESI
jgi:hypothetical protein